MTWQMAHGMFTYTDLYRNTAITRPTDTLTHRPPWSDCYISTSYHTQFLFNISKMFIDQILCPIHMLSHCLKATPVWCSITNNPMCFLSTCCCTHTSTSSHTVSCALPRSYFVLHTRSLVALPPQSSPCSVISQSHTVSHHDVSIRMSSYTS